MLLGIILRWESLVLEAMPKVKPTLAALLRSYVREFPSDFTTNDKILFCQACSKDISFGKRWDVLQHLATAFHKSAVERKRCKRNKTNTHFSLGTELASNSKKSDFNYVGLSLCIYSR